VKLSNQILVQENDFVKAGMPLSDGSVTPNDILNIKGPSAVQQYLVNEVQEVYRLQGVKINDKHFEVVVRQMMRKVRIEDSGDTIFLENQLVHKSDFIDENDDIFGKKVIEDAGDSATLKAGQIVTARELRDENSILKREDKALSFCTRCTSSNGNANFTRYYTCFASNQVIYLCCIVPGNYKSTERSRCKWKS
jgi:DNA-directed RNA polymerase subunit beta'